MELDDLVLTRKSRHLRQIFAPPRRGSATEKLYRAELAPDSGGAGARGGATLRLAPFGCAVVDLRPPCPAHSIR
ncbi:MAG: hypothetical protein WBP48_07445 [Microbacterium sp.]